MATFSGKGCHRTTKSNLIIGLLVLTVLDGESFVWQFLLPSDQENVSVNVFPETIDVDYWALNKFLSIIMPWVMFTKCRPIYFLTSWNYFKLDLGLWLKMSNLCLITLLESILYRHSQSTALLFLIVCVIFYICRVVSGHHISSCLLYTSRCV